MKYSVSSSLLRGSSKGPLGIPYTLQGSHHGGAPSILWNGLAGYKAHHSQVLSFLALHRLVMIWHAWPGTQEDKKLCVLQITPPLPSSLKKWPLQAQELAGGPGARGLLQYSVAQPQE